MSYYSSSCVIYPRYSKKYCANLRTSYVNSAECSKETDFDNIRIGRSSFALAIFIYAPCTSRSYDRVLNPARLCDMKFITRRDCWPSPD